MEHENTRPMPEDQLEEIERKLKAAELAKLEAETDAIRRNKPMTLTVLFGFLGAFSGFGAWMINEFKQYSEGHMALREVEELEQEKNSLQGEVTMILGLKAHYREEAERLRRETTEKQDVIDKAYLKALFAKSEALYAFKHVEVLEDPEARARVAEDMLKVAREAISDLGDALPLIPASDWARDMRYAPSGAFGGNSYILYYEKDDKRRYYDVKEQRFLTDEEEKLIRVP